MSPVCKFLIIVTFFTLTSCLFDSGSENVTGDYEVIWIDVIESRALNKKEELVPAYVYAAGHDSKYIFAKQHPLKINSREKIDTSTTNYYVIETTENEFQDKPKYGPLTKKAFDSLCAKLNISNIKFDMTYPTDL